MRLPVTLIGPIFLLAFGSPALAERSIQEAVADGTRLLSEGAYSEAARAFGQAIEQDPSSYVNYYKRATAYLSMGRQNAALDDFDAILKLNPGFAQAHLQKGRILAKEGEFDRAAEELRAYRQSKPDEESGLLLQDVQAAAGAADLAHRALRDGAWHTCREQATMALEVGPNSAELREARVKCATQMGDISAVYGDLSRLAILSPSALSLPIKLSQMAYFLLASSSANQHIKQCLVYDPDSKPCKKMHKLLRSLDKEEAKARNFADGGNWRQTLKLLDGEDGLLTRFEMAFTEATTPSDTLPYLAEQFEPRTHSEKRKELYVLACKVAIGAGDLGKRGGGWCEIAEQLDPENVDALVYRGERLLKDENWEEAVRTFDRAFEQSGRSSQDILNRLQRAQKLLKVSKQKDYYKVLGVSRDADERTIKKAFRKAAKTAHPDRGGSEDKMAALNEAYEVLIDPELRQRYDNGDDPNNPEQGGGNPFAHHGGGMPFQFFQQGFPGGGGGGGFQQTFFQQSGGGGQKMHFKFGG